MPHWQIRVPNISLARVVVQNYRPRLPSNMTVLMPKLISHFKAVITVNNALLWLYGELIWGWVSFLDCLFFSFSLFCTDFLLYFPPENLAMNTCGKPKQSNFKADKRNWEKCFIFFCRLWYVKKKRCHKKKNVKVLYPQNICNLFCPFPHP